MTVSWRVQALIRSFQVNLSINRCLQLSTKMFFRFRFLFTMSLNLSLGRPWFLFPPRTWELISSKPIYSSLALKQRLGTNRKWPIQVRWRCRSTRLRPWTRSAQKWAESLSTHRFFTPLVLGQSNSLHSLLSSFFKVAPQRTKWSSYVHSYISGTQAVNTTLFCTGTQAMVPRHQVHVDSQPVSEILVIGSKLV